MNWLLDKFVITDLQNYKISTGTVFNGFKIGTDDFTGGLVKNVFENVNIYLTISYKLPSKAAPGSDGDEKK